MSDEQLHKIQGDVVQLQVANATLSTSVNHLADTVRALTETVQVLRDTMNQGRGMMWILMAAAGAIGAVAAAVVRKVLSIA